MKRKGSAYHRTQKYWREIISRAHKDANNATDTLPHQSSVAAAPRRRVDVVASIAGLQEAPSIVHELMELFSNCSYGFDARLILYTKASDLVLPGSERQLEGRGCFVRRDLPDKGRNVYTTEARALNFTNKSRTHVSTMKGSANMQRLSIKRSRFPGAKIYKFHVNHITPQTYVILIETLHNDLTSGIESSQVHLPPSPRNPLY